MAEFDRRRAWSDWGCRSCSHWLSWRCSLSPAAAREHVRIALRLQELPLIRGAFAEGRLSYSQVRALTRVEQVVREEELLSLARHATAAQLERLVRAYRGVVARSRAAADGGPERYVTWDHADDGSLLLHARLPAEEGAIVLAALQAGVDVGGAASAEARADRFRGSAGRARFRGSARVEPASAEAPALTPLPRKRRGSASGGPTRSSSWPTRCWRAKPAGAAATATRSSCTSTPRRCAMRHGGIASSRTVRRSRPRPRAGSPATPRSCRCSSAPAGR